MSTSMDPAPSEVTVSAEEVEGSRPRACWSVREGAWSAGLPAEVAALLAPPVIVSAEAFAPTTVRSRHENGASAGSGRTPRDNSAPVAYGPRHAAPDDATSRFITPGLHRRLRNRRPAHAA
ncbi:hypothetical protein [Planosporangium mesophilum]|uniref:Uncharacterized protein n=1 Tax=Planosporangium mesophilum TaxID=689768 RepID=A0A8J3TI44_9ACTN|nr:hypothetical protein [Planosporangium mesophilum]NJC86049.1 hypothetical protein [Planosporangium mesophilum]GII25557.1 hypothetical protein Pme01_51540 [Planosporangium mesophilum]